MSLKTLKLGVSLKIYGKIYICLSVRMVLASFLSSALSLCLSLSLSVSPFRALSLSVSLSSSLALSLSICLSLSLPPSPSLSLSLSFAPRPSLSQSRSHFLSFCLTHVALFISPRCSKYHKKSHSLIKIHKVKKFYEVSRQSFKTNNGKSIDRKLECQLTL